MSSLGESSDLDPSDHTARNTLTLHQLSGKYCSFYAIKVQLYLNFFTITAHIQPREKPFSHISNINFHCHSTGLLHSTLP